LFQRNGSEVEVQPLGVGTWNQVDSGYQVETGFRLKAAEGTFNLRLVLIGTEGENVIGRQWHIIVPDAGLTPASRTSYGRLLDELSTEAEKIAQNWIFTITQQKMPAGAYIETLPLAERAPLRMLQTAAVACPSVPPEFALLATLSGLQGNPNPDWDPVFSAMMKRHCFQIEGPVFVEKKKEQELNQRIYESWKLASIVPAGSNRLQNPETTPILTITDSEIVYSFPIEIGLPTSPMTHAKGRLIVSSAVPSLVREMHDLKIKGKANPETTDATPTELLSTRPNREWRVVRIETNLEPLAAAERPPGPGGPASPGGPFPTGPGGGP
jgi:hypothetical protein